MQQQSEHGSTNRYAGPGNKSSKHHGVVMRILVGTLYTIENEFEECCAAIRAQTHQNFEHLVLKGLPNKEAHDRLYRTFEQRCHEFDLMIKVDADMVIENRFLFEKIVNKFQADRNLNWLCMQVHDFYCNRLIWGLNVYRNTIRWKYRDEQLFVDLIMDPLSLKKKELHDRELAPAAIHCKNPSPYQAFHFGFHRGQKCAQPGRIRASRQTLQWKIFNDVLKHFHETRDVRLAYALAGFELAIAGSFAESIVSFDNSYLSALFTKEFARKTDRELWGYVKRKRLSRLALLPYPCDFFIMYCLQRVRALAGC